MRNTIIRHLDARFQAWADLASAIDDDLMQEKLPVDKSKSLKEHFWCVIGGRESYTAALKAGAWDGFNCSLQTVDRAEVSQTLATSAATFQETIANIDDWTDERDELLTALFEHEVMHEGQVIRLMYGLGKNLPASWTWA